METEVFKLKYIQLVIGVISNKWFHNNNDKKNTEEHYQIYVNTGPFIQQINTNNLHK